MRFRIKTVFVVDSFSVELILLPSAPLFQKTVFAADSFFSAPIFPLSPLFQKLFVFHGMPSFGLTQHDVSLVSVSLRCLSASLCLFERSSRCSKVSAFLHCLSASLEFLKRSSLPHESAMFQLSDG